MLPETGRSMTNRGGSWGNPRTTTPEWRRLRQLILQRDQHTCYLDQAPANEVDHVDGNHLNNDPANLRAICTPCHRKKSSAEGHQARATKAATSRRPPEQHPGLR